MRRRAPDAGRTNDRQRMGGELRQVDVVGVGDDVAGKMALIEPAGEGEGAALRAAELHDLGEDDGAGPGGGRG